jgi:hypothetical protein
MELFSSEDYVTDKLRNENNELSGEGVVQITSQNA